MTKFIHYLLFVVLLWGSVTNTQAQQYLANFDDLDGSTTTSPTSPYTGGVAATGISSVAWTGANRRYAGVTGATDYAYGYSGGNNTYTLTLNLTATYNISITGISYEAQRSASGAQTATIRINGTTAFSGSITDGSYGTISNTNLSGFNNLTGSVTITVVNTAASGSGTNRMDNFSVFGTLLPVTLIAFDATMIDGSAHLTFSTAGERNNAYYEIERSTDGSRFQTIGRVAGAVNTHYTSEYSFEDKHPLNGTNYYRLKQTDLDGRFAYSPVVVVLNMLQQRLRIQPMAGGTSVRVSLAQGTFSEGIYEVFDSRGLLMTGGAISVESETFYLETFGWPSGVYIMRTTINRRTQTALFNL